MATRGSDLPFNAAYGQSPCKDCADRWVNADGRCHDSCARYAEWCAVVRTEKEKCAKNLAADCEVASYEVAVNRRMKKRRR